jgi:rubrerythrin
MRLIDADALKAEWYKINDIGPEDCGARFVGYQEIARLINNAPTVETTGDYISRADAIEAVRYLIYDRQEKGAKPFKWWFIKQRLNAIPSADAVSCEFYEDAVKANIRLVIENRELKEQIESADAVQGLGRYEKAMQKLREMPSYINGVKAKQIKKIPSDAVHGEWIWRTDIPIGDGRTSAGYICSNCGKDYWHGNVFNYCPSCGARMKGGDAE